MNRETTAVFIGNRDCYDVSIQKIKDAITDAINAGITTFVSGGLGYFDETCANLVHELKAQYPNIKNVLLIPYRNFRVFNKDIFDEITFPFEHDHTTYIDYKSAIPRRNEIMVSMSGTAICCVHREGGASRTLELAKNQKLKIINIPYTA